jgi:uncharacterized protein (TIGR00106 family)
LQSADVPNEEHEEAVLIADFSISPIGKGESLSGCIAEVFALIERSGLPYEHHAMGTNIEGSWDDVMGLIDACRRLMHVHADRVSISIKIDDRKGVSEGLSKKVASAERKMNDRDE